MDFNPNYGSLYDLAGQTNPLDDPHFLRRFTHGQAMAPTALTGPQLEEYVQQEQAANPTVSALHWLGGILDKPFRPIRAGLAAVRNLIAPGFGQGQAQYDPSEFLAFLPGSDYFGLTNEKNATEMRDVLGFGKRPEGGGIDLGDLAGLVGDVALGFKVMPRFGANLKPSGKIAQPSTPGGSPQAFGMSLGGHGSAGALTPEAELLAKYGGLPMSAQSRMAGLGKETIPGMFGGEKPYGVWEQILGEATKAAPQQAAPDLGKLLGLAERVGAGETVPLQGVFRVPLTNTIVGTEPGAVRNIAQALTFPYGGIPFSEGRVGDFLSNALKYNAVGRLARGLFSGQTGGQFSKAGQEGMENVVKPLIDTGTHRQAMGVRGTLGEFYGNAGVTSADQLKSLHNYIADLAEGVTPGAAPPAWLTPAGQTASQDAVAGLRAMRQQLRDSNIKLGAITAPEIENAWPRHMTGPGTGIFTSGESTVSSVPTSARGFMARELPEGLSRNVVDQMIADAEISGSGRSILAQGKPVNRLDESSAIAKIRDKYGGFEGGVPEGQEAAVYNWLRSRPNVYAEKGLRAFGQHPFQDMMQALVEESKVNAGLESIHRLLAANARPMLGENAGQGLMSMNEALHRIGLEAEKAASGAPRIAGDAAREALAAKLSQMTGQKVSAEGIYHFGVPYDVVQGLNHTTAAVFSPEKSSFFWRAFDTYNNLYKNYVTSLFPAYHTANTVGGFFTNMLNGVGMKDYKYGMGAITDNPNLEKGLAKALNFKGSAPEVADREAMRLLQQEGQSWGFLGNRVAVNREMQLPVAQEGVIGNLLQPGQKGFIGGEQPWFQQGFYNPVAARGVYQQGAGTASIGSAAETQFLPLRAGETAANLSDSVNKMAHYAAKRIEGLSPEAAAAATKAMHADFSTLSPFERDWMRRVFTFYTWPKSIVGAISEKALHEPGKLAALTRLSELGQSTDFMPESLRSNTWMALGSPEQWAHPVSGREETRQTFQRLLPPLPHEEALRWFSFPGGGSAADVASTFRDKFGAALAPMLRAPLEAYSGREFYSGRTSERKDRFPDVEAQNPLGIPEALRGILPYTPASRFFTSAERAARQEQLGMPIEQSIAQELVPGVPQQRIVDVAGARDREARETLERLLRPYSTTTTGPIQIDPMQRDQLWSDPVARLRLQAYEALRGLGAERTKGRTIENLSDLLTNEKRPEQANYLQALMDLNLTQLQQERARREYHDLNPTSRMGSPAARMLSSQARSQARILADLMNPR